MKKIGYISIVIVTSYLCVMYQWTAGPYLLAAELWFWILGEMGAYYFSRKAELHMEMDKILTEQKEECQIHVQIHNRSRVPLTVKTVIEYRYLSGGKKRRIITSAYVKGRKTECMTCSLLPEHCGKIEIRMKKSYCCDWTGIFQKARSWNERVSVTVMPNPYPVNLVVSSRTRWFPIDGESYAQNRSGDDAAEIYDVREYQAGDRMQKVHWKLSAREDDLFIKEFSYPLGAAIVLLLEEDRHHTEITHKFSEAVVSVAVALTEAKCPYYMVWKKKEDDRIRRLLIRTEEDIYEAVLCLLQFTNGCLESDMEEMYRYEYKNDTYSTMIKIDTGLMLQINGNEKISMSAGRLEQFFHDTEIVV